MAYLTSIDTSTLTDQSINAALLVHTFTNTVRVRKIFVNVFVKDIVGGGDYTAHLTWDRGGVAQFYESIKTIKPVAAATTTTCFESIPLVVDAAGVVRVYLLGLAGDNVGAVDIITDIYEEFVFSQTGDAYADAHEALTRLPDATPGTNGGLPLTDAQGVKLSATQGDVEFGQLKVTKNIAGEGAVHVVNANAMGIGVYREGRHGSLNMGTTYGEENFGVDVGQYNHGLMQYGTESQGGVSALYPDYPAMITTLTNRLGAFTGSGLNTVLGFLRAIMRKTAALTPSNVGGTYDNVTDSLEAIRDKLTSSKITVTGPVVTTDGDVVTYRGDSYLNEDGRSIEWESDDWPDLTGGSVKVIIHNKVQFNGTVVTPVGTVKVRLELTAVQSATIDAGRHNFQVVGTQSDGDVATLVAAAWVSRARAEV